MKACVLKAVGQLEYEEVKTPSPGKGEVLLKIKASGICGSDIGRVFVKGTYSFPTIPGHEFAGEIVELGEGVQKDLLHKKAAVFPLLPCRVCDMCEVGEYASCRNYDYFGSRRDGGFAEYLAVPVWNLVIGDQSLSYEEMAMAEPAAVSLHALSRAGVELGDNVAIFGAGAIGLMLAEFAKAWGAGRVIPLDIEPAKIDFAKRIGFDGCFKQRRLGLGGKTLCADKREGRGPYGGRRRRAARAGRIFKDYQTAWESGADGQSGGRYAFITA